MTIAKIRFHCILNKVHAREVHLRGIFRIQSDVSYGTIENSNAYEKYEYGHLGLWYIKSTLYKRFLN